MRIKEYRIRLEMSQAELAERVGVTKNYISMLEKGKCIPSVPVLVELSLALNTCPCLILKFRVCTHEK